MLSNIFNDISEEYDQWYDRHKIIFESELESLKKLAGKNGRNLEIGVGTGRFAEHFLPIVGLDFSIHMLQAAGGKKITPVLGLAENLPFQKESFDRVFLLFTLCFLNNPGQVLSEIQRVLTKKGELIMLFLGKHGYSAQKYILNPEHPLHPYMHLKTFEEIVRLLANSGLYPEDVESTVFYYEKDQLHINKMPGADNNADFISLKCRNELS